MKMFKILLIFTFTVFHAGNAQTETKLATSDINKLIKAYGLKESSLPKECRILVSDEYYGCTPIAKINQKLTFCTEKIVDGVTTCIESKKSTHLRLTSINTGKRFSGSVSRKAIGAKTRILKSKITLKRARYDAGVLENAATEGSLLDRGLSWFANATGIGDGNDDGGPC